MNNQKVNFEVEPGLEYCPACDTPTMVTSYDDFMFPSIRGTYPIHGVLHQQCSKCGTLEFFSGEAFDEMHKQMDEYDRIHNNDN